LPEGDTIHKWARRLDAVLTGHPLRKFDFRRDPRGVRAPAPGTVVTGVEARGKHLLMHFDDGTTLHTHMEMDGRWDVYRRGQRWRRPAHTARVAMEIDDGTSVVCFSAPVVELRRAGRAGAPTRASRALDALGPDLCDAGVDLDEVMHRLADVPGTTTIGDALLDQRVAAGIGNVFKSEICWAHRLHPFTPVAAVADDLRRALYTTAHDMLRANLDTPRRITYRDGLAVYGRQRQPCPRDRTPIVRAHSGGDNARTTFWCPTCQPDQRGNGTSAT
jgi:endonuclease-8